jgi:protein-L-isoaspartate(D-aspartate) O-methyltransferase
MLDLLEVKGGQKILEVGSGSGYVLELLAQLNKKGTIFGVERVKELAESSSRVLRQYSNITVKQGDGSKGLKNEEPFDRILVSAAAASIPEKLVEQLKINGILVVPVKNSIVVVKKSALKNKIEEYPGFVFVPLIENEE